MIFLWWTLIKFLIESVLSVCLKFQHQTNTRVSPSDSACELDCKPAHEFYSVKLADAVSDGTPCRPGTTDMCINGLCKVGGGALLRGV